MNLPAPVVVAQSQGPLDKWPRLSVGAAIGQIAQGTASVLALVLVIYQVRQTHESLQLARDSLQLATESVRLERRAWVGPVAVDRWTVQAGQPLSATLVIRNYGSTPALEYEPRITLRPEAPTMADIESAVVERQTSGPLFPGTDKELIAIGTSPASPALVDEIRRGTTRVVLAGMLKYKDVFGARHRTVYCFQVNPELTQWRACAGLNQTD